MDKAAEMQKIYLCARYIMSYLPLVHNVNLLIYHLLVPDLDSIEITNSSKDNRTSKGGAVLF